MFAVPFYSAFLMFLYPVTLGQKIGQTTSHWEKNIVTTTAAPPFNGGLVCTGSAAPWPPGWPDGCHHLIALCAQPQQEYCMGLNDSTTELGFFSNNIESFKLCGGLNVTFLDEPISRDNFGPGVKKWEYARLKTTGSCYLPDMNALDTGVSNVVSAITVKDIDECVPGWNRCTRAQKCNNFKGYYTCSCNEDSGWYNAVKFTTNVDWPRCRCGKESYQKGDKCVPFTECGQDEIEIRAPLGNQLHRADIDDTGPFYDRQCKKLAVVNQEMIMRLEERANETDVIVFCVCLYVVHECVSISFVPHSLSPSLLLSVFLALVLRLFFLVYFSCTEY
eukprot:m.145881 g.145881  ORF g.145881 m.145881 type:complete len:333 (+) comp14958_c0_seq12:205-1203(+)